MRRINFTGNTKTRDEVIRREMRQQERAWISTKQVERGKIRLQQTGYFKDVNVETLSVPGTTDQVDVNYTIEEAPGGNLTAGLGFLLLRVLFLMLVLLRITLWVVANAFLSTLITVI